MRRRRIAIGGGENKGQVFDYINVVRGMHRIGPWTGHAAHFEVPRHAAQVADADSYVVVLQGGNEGRPTRILGAAKAPASKRHRASKRHWSSDACRASGGAPGSLPGHRLTERPV